MSELGDRSVPIVEGKVLKEIEVYYEIVSKSYRFPYGYCIDTSEYLCKEFDLKHVEGKFVFDKPDPVRSKRYCYHEWCEDRLGSIIDLTALQFNICLFESIPVGVYICTVDDPNFWRYFNPSGD